jgi:hypothetical protein
MISSVATWDDVQRLAAVLPEAVEETSRGNRSWTVNGKGFVWERPLRKSDLAALGDRAPDGPVLAAHVEHVGIKDLLIQQDPTVFFTTPHFNGYPAILVRLGQISVADLEHVIEDAWLARAPKRLVKTYVTER